MAIKGVPGSILDHAPGCDGREFSKCQAVYREHPENDIVVLRMDWCGDCGAADWEVV